jgi:hypothetical protein
MATKHHLPKGSPTTHPALNAVCDEACIIVSEYSMIELEEHEKRFDSADCGTFQALIS